MKFPKLFKGKAAVAPGHSSSDSGSGTPRHSPSNKSVLKNQVAHCTRSRKVVNTDKVRRIVGVECQEDIERIIALQSECINDDSLDTSFEDDALQAKQQQRKQQQQQICFADPDFHMRFRDTLFEDEAKTPQLQRQQQYFGEPEFCARRLSSPFKDDLEERRKSDFSLHSTDYGSPSSSSPWMSTPPSRAQSPGGPLRLPGLRDRAAGAAPSVLPLQPRGPQAWHDEVHLKHSPTSSPLRSPRSQMLSPRRSPPTAPESWELLHELGRGSFGTVYKGLNKDGSYFAVKVVRDSTAFKEIQQEVTILSALDHPNIVRYLGSSIDRNGDLCIFLELMMNSLKSVMAELGKGFEENTIRNYVRQILHGLVYLHDQKTIHRDIKCANILVNASGQVKLADFGVAKQTPLTSSVKGSPFYMAPEILSPGARSYGSPVDIWSLGCTMLEMANGKEPWSDTPGFAFYFKMARGQHPPIPDHLSSAAKDFILSCLRFKPEERPTAAKLLQHRFLAETTASTYNSPLASPRRALASFLQEQQQQQHAIQGLRRNGNLNLINNSSNNSSSSNIATLVYRDHEVVFGTPHNMDSLLDREFQGILM